MEKCFNTAGPCNPAEYYMLPALDRLPEIRRLVGMRRYFVVHASRQTGKTTALKALVREINAKSEMVALYCTLETLQNAKGVDDAMPKIRRLLLRNFTAEEVAGFTHSTRRPLGRRSRRAFSTR